MKVEPLDVVDLDKVGDNQTCPLDPPTVQPHAAASTPLAVAVVAAKWHKKSKKSKSVAVPFKMNRMNTAAWWMDAQTRMNPDDHGKVGYFTHHKTGHQRALLRNFALFTRTPLWSLVLLFMLANSLCVILFALLFYTFGGSCYLLSAPFSFLQMLWLSIHVFSTVGFGSDSPAGTCAGPQLLVFLEHFVGLIDVAIFTAVILSKLMQPYPDPVRFSKKFLISNEEDGKWLTFRIVRCSPHQLRDCELSVRCGIASRAEGIVTGCTEEALPLHCAFKSNLETWCVRHQINVSSPLSQQRFKDLAYMNVTLKVFDTASVQEVRLYHNYAPWTDMVCNARFETMKSWTYATPHSSSSNGQVALQHASTRPLIHHLHHIVDHSKLDAFEQLPV